MVPWDPKSADPNLRVVAIILCKIQTVHNIQNPKSEIQNPKPKIQDPKSKIQNPRSKIQDPKSKIQTAALGAATKRMDTTTIQNPKSKIQNPKSKIQETFGFWILEFGFVWPGWGGYVANALVWMGWPSKSGVVGRGSSL